jgi:hypothetical protein
MRFPKGILAAAGLAVIAAGCSSGTSSVPQTMSNGSSQSFVKASQLVRSGIDTRLGFHAYRGGVAAPDAAAGFSLLAVTDGDLNSILQFNKTYKNTGSITNGIDGADGNWIDASGNQYAAQYAAINVVEYNKAAAKKNGAPTFTYTAGLTDPVGVTTDTSGNVFVADYGDGSAGVVVEYKQGKNTALASCNTGLANEGIVVDTKGDVFVSGNNPSTGTGQLVEYKGGLGKCKATALAPTTEFAGGLQLDNKNNLVACDQNTPSVDIIPPPYKATKTSLSIQDPFHVALTKNNKLIFVASPNLEEVQVLDYPSGSAVTTLGSANGLSLPYGVATFPYQAKK